ncbi:MAG: hypothetical protein NZ483_06890 [Verrucomicrobiae bacterium]|nr:hypothetical protein [Verrucomicrobiae bacterium]
MAMPSDSLLDLTGAVVTLQREAENDVGMDAEDLFIPPFPKQLSDLGVDQTFLGHLALKAVALEADPTTARVAERLGLGTLITDQILDLLCRDHLIEKRGVVSPRNHRFQMLDRGWDTLARIRRINSYCGPAPVSLAAYSELIVKQVRSRPTVTQKALDDALANLVLTPAARQVLGLVASSGRSLFLSGPPGNGKTEMARALVHTLPGTLWIPYAIEVDNEVIQIFDEHCHQRCPVSTEDYDHRWVKIRPPLVMAGGELTLESLDLCEGNLPGFYEAPFQVKANGGVLVIDDLGRQRCSPTELLNRWIIPLEHRVDYLTLRTGKKIRVPFEQIVVFATNLTVEDIADEAFLRRMGYRLYLMPPSPDTYAEIFFRYARTKGLAVEPGLMQHIEQRYGRERRTPKACEPRDLIERAIEVCKFNREPIRLTRETIDQAWAGYFGATATG